MDAPSSKQISAGVKGRSCGYKGSSSRKSKDRFYNSEDFMVNSFKVLPCFKKYRHDWWVCPYAHEGETAKRRDPKKFKYVGVACPDAKQGKACPRGDDCPCTHNVFEYWLHPTRFRTAFCGRGIHCTRPFCFFAHSLNEMRKPSLDDLLVVIQGDSLFNEDMLKRALEEHKKDVERLGGKDSNSELLDMSFLQTPHTDIDGTKEAISPNAPPKSPSPRNYLHGGPEQSPRNLHSPVMHSPNQSPIRGSSAYDGNHQNAIRDMYLQSPRDLSPGGEMTRGRTHVDTRGPPGMLPNMQSPREVLGFMNSMLMTTSSRDLSPENLQYVQGLCARDDISALMTATPSPRDLSPHSRHSPMDLYNFQSPRGISPPSHHLNASASQRDISPMHSIEGALLERMNSRREYTPEDDHLNPMYSGGGMRVTMPAPNLSPRGASWHEGEMAELVSKAVQMEGGNSSRGKAAGAYHGERIQNGGDPVQRTISMTSEEQSAMLLEMNMMRERLAELEVIRSGGHSPGLEAQRTQSGIEAHQHSTMPLTTAGSTAYMEGRQLHESTLQQQQQQIQVQEALMMPSRPMRSSYEATMSPSFHEGRHASPGPSPSMGTANVADDGTGFPESLQAVLRSLSKEDQDYLQEEDASASTRPFSSISGLW